MACLVGLLERGAAFHGRLIGARGDIRAKTRNGRQCRFAVATGVGMLEIIVYGDR
jgi:hypothetical protein